MFHVIYVKQKLTRYDIISHWQLRQDQSRVSNQRSEFIFPFYHIPVLITSCIDLERLPTMSPKISIVYFVSSLRSVMAMLRSSPPSTSSLGWPGSSVWLTIITKVSKESSSANHVSLKPSGVTSEIRRACTSGSVSEWQGKINFPSLCEECFHISGTFHWKIMYQFLWE